MTSSDHAAALDDLILQRHRHCTLCGDGHPVWMGLWPETATYHGLRVAVSLCERCSRAADTWARLDHLMERRYGEGQ
jgi:hypothetical protein